MANEIPDSALNPQKNVGGVPDSALDPWAAPEKPTVLGEIPKGLKAGVQQLRGMGYGIGALAGEATGIEPVKKWAKEGLADVETKTPLPAVGSFTDIGKEGNYASDAAKYLAYGVSSNLPNLLLSLTGGGLGAFAGKRMVAGAVEKAVGKAAQNAIIRKAAITGAGIGAGASSLGMEAGSIASDQLTETGKVGPLRAIAGAIPAAALDILPQISFLKRFGLLGKAIDFGEGAKYTGKGILDRVAFMTKEGARQFVMEAPTEAMQSVFERAAVEGKSLTDQDAVREYIDSFVLGGMTGGIIGGAGGAFTKRTERPLNPIVESLKADPLEQQRQEIINSDSDLLAMQKQIDTPIFGTPPPIIQGAPIQEAAPTGIAPNIPETPPALPVAETSPEAQVLTPAEESVPPVIVPPAPSETTETAPGGPAELEAGGTLITGQEAPTEQTAKQTPPAENQDPFAYQDHNQEQVYKDFRKGQYYRYNALEGAGDIFRELALHNEEADFSYISEKISHIEDQIKQERRGIHPDDSFETSRRENQDAFRRLEKQWNNQPVTSDIQKVAVELNKNMLQGDFATAEKTIQKIKDYFKKEEAPKLPSPAPVVQPEPTSRGKSAITFSRGGAEPHTMEATGTFVGNKFIAQDEATIAYGKSEKTYGVYQDGVQIKGGFDKASDAIEFAKQPGATSQAKQPWEMTQSQLLNDPSPLLSEELRQLHNHLARASGLGVSNDVAATSYLKQLESLINERSPGRAKLIDDALAEYYKGNYGKATELSEKALQYLHYDELMNLKWDRIENLHKEAIKQAILKGKSVPPEVLADYPDLQPKEIPSPAPLVQPGRTPGGNVPIPYSRDLKITNLEGIAKGTGARYLRVIRGEGDAWVGRGWARKIPRDMRRGEFLVDMEPGIKEAPPEPLPEAPGVAATRAKNAEVKARLTKPIAPERMKIINNLEKLTRSLSKKDEFASIPVGRYHFTPTEQQEMVKRGITFDVDRMGKPQIRLSQKTKINELREKVKAARKPSTSKNPINAIIQEIKKSGGLGLGTKADVRTNTPGTGLKAVTDAATIRQLTRQYPGLIRGNGNANLDTIAETYGLTADDLVEVLKDPSELGKRQKAVTEHGEGTISSTQEAQTEKLADEEVRKFAQEQEREYNEQRREELTDKLIELKEYGVASQQIIETLREDGFSDEEIKAAFEGTIKEEIAGEIAEDNEFIEYPPEVITAELDRIFEQDMLATAETKAEGKPLSETRPGAVSIPLHEAIHNFKSMQDAVSWLIENSPTPEFRDIAKKIKSHVGDKKILVVEKDTSVPDVVAKSLKRADAVWYSEGDQSVLYINGKDNGGQVVDHLILHELIHEATAKKIAYGNKIANKNTDTGKAVHDLFNLQGDIVDYVNNRRMKGEVGVLDEIAAVDLENVNEIVAYGLSNNIFRKFLSDIKLPNGTALEELGRVADSILGEPPAKKPRITPKVVGGNPFKDSKAESVVFHGTRQKFNNFSNNVKHKNYPTTKGIMFVADRSEAEFYTNKFDNDHREFKGNSPRVIEAYLDIKNPLEIDAKGSATNYYDVHQDRILANVKRGKNDGIIIKDDEGLDVYVVFNDKQIHQLPNPSRASEVKKITPVQGELGGRLLGADQFTLAPPRGEVGDKLNANNEPRNAELFGGEKLTLPSGVNFGGNIKAEDANNLVNKAHELRDNRKAEGQKELDALGRDGVASLAEKAKNGDWKSLAKLDSLLADVSGGPGNFQKNMHWKADSFVKALDKYLTSTQSEMAQRSEFGNEPRRSATEENLVNAVNAFRRNETRKGYTPEEIAKAYEEATGQTFPYRELVTILDKLGTKVSFNVKKMHNKHAAAVYDPDTNEIIFGEATMKYTDDPIGKYSEIVAHEGIHAIVINMRSLNMPAYIEMRSRLNSFLKDITPHLGSANYFTQAAIEKITKENLVDELVTLGFTNKDFATWLDSIPGRTAESGSLWSRFKEIIRKAIGKVATNTKLDELNQIMDSVMEIGEAGGKGDIAGFPQQDMADFSVEVNLMPKDEQPNKTITAYKLFEVRKGYPGKLFPLFIGRNAPYEIGKWYKGEFIPTKGFADRPGIHSGTLPTAPHLMKKDGTMNGNRVWAEISIPADVDWQGQADASKTKDIRTEVPVGGYYRFKTNKMQGGAWNISGGMKIERILSAEDVNAILTETKGVTTNEDMARRSQLQTSKASKTSNQTAGVSNAGLLTKNATVRPERNQSDYQILRDKLVSLLPPQSGDIDFQAVQVNGKNADFIKGIAGIFGSKVKFFQSETPGLRDSFLGFTDQTNYPNTIFLNVQSPAPHLQTLGHELMHQLQVRDPELYSDFLAALEPYVKNTPGYKRLSITNNSYINDSQLVREFTAEFIEHRFMDQKFWDGMIEKNPSVFSRVMQYIKNILDKVKEYIEKGRNIDSDYISDLNKARQIAVLTLTKYRSRQAARGTQDVSGDTFMPSKVSPLTDLMKRTIGTAAAQFTNPRTTPSETVQSMRRTFQAQGAKEMRWWDSFFSVPFRFSQKYNDPAEGGQWEGLWDVHVNRRAENRAELTSRGLKTGDDFISLQKKWKKEGLSNKEVDAGLAKVERIITAGNIILHERLQNLTEQIKGKTGAEFTSLQKQINEIRTLRRFSDAELKAGVIDEYGDKIAPLTDREIAAYVAARNGYDSSWKEMIAHLSDMTFRKYKNQKWVGILHAAAGAELNKDEILTLLNRKGLDKAALAKAQSIQVDIASVFSQIEKGLTTTPPEEISAAGEKYDKLFVKMATELKTLQGYVGQVTGIKDKEELAKTTRELFSAYLMTRPQTKEISRIRNEALEWPGYAPQYREQGKMKGRLVEKFLDDNGDIELDEQGVPVEDRQIHMEMVNNEKEAERLLEKMIKLYPDQFEKDGSLKPGYSVEWEPITNSPEAAFQGVNDVNVQKIIDDALGNMKVGETYYNRNGEKIDIADALRDAAFQSIANQFKKRGAMRYTLHRNQKYGAIKGYQEIGLQKVYVNYISSMAGLMTKQQAALDSLEILSQIKDPAMFTGMSKWNREMLRNESPADRVAGMAKSVAFTYMLGGLLKSAAVNATQPVMVGIPELKKYMREHNVQGMAGPVMVKASSDVLMGKTSETEKKLMEEAIRKGVATDQYIQSIFDTLRGRFGEKAYGAMRLLGIPFSKVEVHNRLTTLIAFFRVAYPVELKAAKERGLSGVEAETAAYEAVFDGARTFNNNVNYAYGKANRPLVIQSGDLIGVTGSALYTFKAFSHNFLARQAELLSKGDFRTFAHTMAYMAVFGGLMGLPFFKDFFEWYEKKFGYSPTNAIRKTLRGIGGKTLETLGVSGLPSVLGANISGSINIGLPWPFGSSSPSDSVFGVMGALATRGVNISQALGRGDIDRAVTEFSPEFMRAPLTAMKESEIGKDLFGFQGFATNPRGNVAYDENGEPITLSTKETLIKMGGFNPTERARKMEMNAAAMRLTAWAANQKTNIAETLRIARLQKKPSAIKDAMKSVRELNQKIRDRGLQKLVPLASMQRIIQSSRQIPGMRQRREASFKRAEL